MLRELKCLFSKQKPGVENITHLINWISLNMKKWIYILAGEMKDL